MSEHEGDHSQQSKNLSSEAGTETQPDVTVVASVGSSLPAGWKTLETQVGGHQFTHGEYEHQKLGMVDLGNGFVLKSLQNPPRGTRELGFYQKVFDPACTDPDLLELRPFLSPFLGSEERNGAKFLKLANLTSGFKHPCVIDLKIGRVTYDQEATAEKIEHEIGKYPPLKNLGFQITGMMVYDHQTQSNVQYGKPYCKNLTEENIVNEGLGCFFGLRNGALRRDVIQPLVSKLKKLESWFLKQKKFSFIASSLLIVYEGLNLTGSISTHPTKTGVTSVNQGEDRCKNVASVNHDAKSAFTTDAEYAVPNHDESKADSKPPSITCQKRSNDETEILGDERVKKAKLSDQSKADSETETCSTAVKGSSSSKLVDVHLIDFAHAFPADDIDKNFLFGLQKVIDCLQTLLK